MAKRIIDPSRRRRRTDVDSQTAPQAEPGALAILREEIERRAYARFLERGMTHGGDLDDWLEAERELLVSPPA